MLKVLISVHSKCEVYHNVKNPVVQRVDGIVPRIINHHPVDSTICCTCPIAVITVEPAGKASFVLGCIQTRLMGQYNGK